MSAIYFAGDASAGGDGSQDHPFVDPSQLPGGAGEMVGGDYFLRSDTAFNWTTVLKRSTFTSSPITVQPWGSGAAPIISMYRMVDRSECVEVALVDWPTSSKTTPSSGTNYWRVPYTFFGLYAGKVWGAQTDVMGTIPPTGNKKLPALAREFCTCYDATGTTLYRMVRSAGNPVDVYGGLFAASVSDADFIAGGAKVSAISGNQVRSGLLVAGIDFDVVYNAVAFLNSTPAALCADNIVTECRIKNAYRGVTFTGDGSWLSGAGFDNARVEKCYGENLARSFVDTINEVCMNRARIDKNVLNGFGHTYSTGGFYLGLTYTLDGSYILCERNCATGGVGGNMWLEDGFAFYQEQRTRKLIFRRNFSWGNDLNFINYIGEGDDQAYQNVAIAKNRLDKPDWSRMFQNNPVALSDVTLWGNVAIGFLRFMAGDASKTGRCRVQNNVSYSCGDLSPTGPGSISPAIYTDSHSTASLTVDGNNFYGHDALWRDWSDGLDYPGNCTNGIAGDPADQLRCIPNPTDPTVNYALMISPNFWSGTVDLRPGTRLA